jgi:hypothetical protein
MPERVERWRCVGEGGRGWVYVYFSLSVLVCISTAMSLLLLKRGEFARSFWSLRLLLLEELRDGELRGIVMYCYVLLLLAMDCR